MCQHRGIVPRSRAEVSAGRAGSVCAVLLVLAIGVHVSLGSAPRDDASYEAGYRAASHSTLIRETITAHATPSTLCNTMVEHALRADEPPRIVQDDFISGCTRAIAEAME